MNPGLQPPSALAIVRELVRGQAEPEAPRAWLLVLVAIAAAVLPALAILVGAAP